MQLHEMFNRPQHAELLGLLAESHYRAALNNDNTSSAVAVAVYAASGDLENAVNAAALAQGGLHAPIAKARRWFSFRNPEEAARYLLSERVRLPGFGNSFYKTRVDPAFFDLYHALPDEQYAVITAVNRAVPKLYPNAAIITAAVCEAAELPHGIEATLFVRCRAPAWMKLCLAQKSPKVGTP